MGPRKRPWLRELGIALFAIAVRTHGEDGEGSTLAAIVFFEFREKDAILRRNSKIFVVLARADKFYLYVALMPLREIFFSLNYARQLHAVIVRIIIRKEIEVE